LADLEALQLMRQGIQHPCCSLQHPAV
jgi:hypothetical protein